MVGKNITHIEFEEKLKKMNKKIIEVETIKIPESVVRVYVSPHVFIRVINKVLYENVFREETYYEKTTVYTYYYFTQEFVYITDIAKKETEVEVIEE